jgi:hypothetical protein
MKYPFVAEMMTSSTHLYKTLYTSRSYLIDPIHQYNPTTNMSGKSVKSPTLTRRFFTETHLISFIIVFKDSVTSEEISQQIREIEAAGP